MMFFKKHLKILLNTRFLMISLLYQKNFMPDAFEFVYFFHCQKSNKKSSDPKNSFIIRSFAWHPGLPKACLYFTCPVSFSFARKKPAAGTLKQFWATVLSAENDFLNNVI